LGRQRRAKAAASSASSCRWPGRRDQQSWQGQSGKSVLWHGTARPPLPLLRGRMRRAYTLGFCSHVSRIRNGSSVRPCHCGWPDRLHSKALPGGGTAGRWCMFSCSGWLRWVLASAGAWCRHCPAGGQVTLPQPMLASWFSSSR
jgi:hypothetical protein